jgi:hypothetical protein
MSKNNKKKQKTKQKKTETTKTKAERMDRAHMLLRETGHKSNYNDSKADIEHAKTNSKYKTGHAKDMTNLSAKAA